MNKKTFKPFRLEELNWWINIQNSPSEIEDKQAVDITNWNFQWNKLVSEKWFKDSWNPSSGLIWALKIDGSDKWTFAGGRLYKNWEIQTDKSWILLYVGESSFVPNIPYPLNLDWIDYLFEWDSIENIILDIKSKVPSSYNIVAQEDTILITKDSWDITYVWSENQTYIIYNRDSVASYTLWDSISTKIIIDGVEYSNDYSYDNWALNVWELDIDIMEKLMAVIPSKHSPSLVFLNSALDIVVDYESTGWFAWILLNQVNTIKETKISIYRYRIRGYSEDTWWGWYIRLDDWTWGEDLFYIDWNPIIWLYWYKIRANSANGIQMALSTLTIDWETFTIPAWTQRWDVWGILYAEMAWNTFYRDVDQYNESIYFVRKDWVPISSISWTWEFSDFWQANLSEYSFSGSLFTIWRSDCNDDWASFNDSEIEKALKWNLIYQINSLNWFSAEEWILEWLLWIIVTKWDWDFANITYVSTNSTVFTHVGFSPWDVGYSFIEEWAFIDVKTNSLTETSVIDLQSTLNYSRWNIVIWQDWWVLYVDKDNGWAYYYYDWMRAKIWTDSVWNPTVWAIYNGKIILSWYKDNDNIVFSKTSSPTEPLNILNFSDYSAGWQSVSWWDKWLVTGMIEWENWLYVFKNNSIYYSNSEKDAPESFSFNLIFNKITSNWALSQNVITEVEQEIFYLDWESREVRRLWYEQDLTTLRDTAISREISDLFDELPEEQPLATAHFKYPNYQLSLSDWQWATVEYNGWYTYNVNNVHFVYNVENKSWTRRTWIDWLLISDRGHFADIDWRIYIDFDWETSESGEYVSKEYVFWDDIMYKKYWRFEVVWKIKTPNSSDKELTISLYVDDELVDERLIQSEWEVTHIRQKIDMYDIGQRIQFKLTHSWEWNVEIHDIQIYYKRTRIQPQDYN